MIKDDDIFENMNIEEKKVKRRKYRKCAYCIKQISKTNYSRHLYLNHYNKLSKFKKKKYLRERFTDGMKKIKDNLKEIKDLLKIMKLLKLNSGDIENEELNNKEWYLNYNEKLDKLHQLLIDNDEEEK